MRYRPVQIIYALVAFWIALLGSSIATRVLVIDVTIANPSTLIILLTRLAVFAVITVALLRGFSWARIMFAIFLALDVLDTASSEGMIRKMDKPTLMVSAILFDLVYAGAVIALFREPSRGWFEAPR
jgi:hypothetical protein